MSSQGFPSNAESDSTGDAPEVTPELQVSNRAIKDVNQAFSVAENIISDWKNGIKKSARITAKLNGERPYNQAALKKAGKDWKANISTGFLSTECNRVLPRLYMPIKTAKYLTASELPAGHPNGQEKTQHFRQVITDAVRAWPKLNFYVRGLAREVGIFGFAFNCFFDDYEWRPTLMRMDKGFVPQGTEIMDEPSFFVAKYDYKPHELLDLVRKNTEVGREEWKREASVAAINKAAPPPRDSTETEERSYEELVRQSTLGYGYAKGAKVIRTWHLFAKETNGTVSHYILLADKIGDGEGAEDMNLLFEHLDQFPSMHDAVHAMVFDYGDGTIHGSWGAGQILYDLSVQVEKVRCDSIDNIRMMNKVKVQVPDAKNVQDVKQLVNDQFVIISGAQFAGNTAGLTSDIAGYEALDQKLTQLAQQKIGAFIPPIPLQPSDIKAAQVNAAMMQEKELQEALLENWLIQWAMLMRTITKRLTNPESPDPDAKATILRLMEKLTPEEIILLRDQFPVKSVMDFTELKAQQRGTFAFTVVNNPLFRQSSVARYMAEGAGDERFVESIVIPEGDQTDQLSAQRQQILENTALLAGKNVPVIPTDNDWGHMEALKPDIQAALTSEQPNVPGAKVGLQHYAGHWEQGVNKKNIPSAKINESKAWIASAEKAIMSFEEQAALQAQIQQAQSQADAEAQMLVQSGQA